MFGDVLMFIRCLLVCRGYCLKLQFLKTRWNLENIGALEPRRSALEDDFEEEEEKEEDEMDVDVDEHEKV